MKIRNSKDVEKLGYRIKEELGIDVLKYKNEEVVENFVELLVFPKYVISWGIRPILISLLIFIIGFFILNLVHIEYIIYTLLGLILFLASGVLMGLLFLTWKMKSDIWGIVDYSFDIMKSAVNDINQVNNQITKNNRKEVLGLLFKGIIHIVTIPLISKVISDKVPFVGRIVKSIVTKILTLVSDKMKFDEDNLKQELEKNENESNILKIYSNSITGASNGLEKVMNFTFGIVRFPLKLGFGIIASFLILFLYLIN